jgi:hypothetical protein
MPTTCCNDNIHHIGDGCLFQCVGIGPRKKEKPRRMKRKKKGGKVIGTKEKKKKN